MAEERRLITAAEARQLAAWLVVNLIRAARERPPDLIAEKDRGALGAALGEIEQEMLRRVMD